MFYNYFLSLYLSDSDNFEEGVYASQIKRVINVLLQQFEKVSDADAEEKSESRFNLN